MPDTLTFEQAQDTSPKTLTFEDARAAIPATLSFEEADNAAHLERRVSFDEAFQPPPLKTQSDLAKNWDAIQRKYAGLLSDAKDSPEAVDRLFAAQRQEEDSLNKAASNAGLRPVTRIKSPQELLGESVERAKMTPEEVDALTGGGGKYIAPIERGIAGAAGGLADPENVIYAPLGEAKMAAALAKPFGAMMVTQGAVQATEGAKDILKGDIAGGTEKIIAAVPTAAMGIAGLKSGPKSKAEILSSELNKSQMEVRTEKVPAPIEQQIDQTIAPVAPATAEALKDTLKGGEENHARNIASAKSVSQPEIRPPVGEEAPLRQQGEVAGTQTLGEGEVQGQKPTLTPALIVNGKPVVGTEHSEISKKLVAEAEAKGDKTAKFHALEAQINDAAHVFILNGDMEHPLSREEAMPHLAEILGKDVTEPVHSAMIPEESKGLPKPASLKLSYDEFKKQYTDAFAKMNKYSVDEVGSSIYAEKMAKLADEYPEFADKAESENPSSPASAEPLGLNRPSKQNPSLRLMSDSEFDAEFRDAKQKVNEAEKTIDEVGELDKLTSEQRKTIGEAQDRWEAADLERYRRNIKDVVPEDLFYKLKEIAGNAVKFGKQSADHQKALMLMEELHRQGATKEQMLSEIKLSSPDAAEVFAADLADIKKLSSPAPEPPPTSKATPPQAEVATPETPKAPVAGKGKVTIKAVNPYGLAPEGEKILTVTGSPVKLKSVPDLDFVAYQPSGKGAWRVIEKNTGMSTGDTHGKTKAEAIAKAEANVTKVGADKVREYVNSADWLNAEKPVKQVPAETAKPVEAKKPFSRAAASDFTKLVLEHAPIRKWGSEKTIADAMMPSAGKNNLGTAGIKGNIARSKAIKTVLEQAAKEIGLDPNQIGNEAYRAENFDKLTEFLAKEFQAEKAHEAETKKPLTPEEEKAALESFTFEEPKPEVRPLTKAEQDRFQELSVKAKAARESGGVSLTTAETQEYQKLEAIAGQNDLSVGGKGHKAAKDLTLDRETAVEKPPEKAAPEQGEFGQGPGAQTKPMGKTETPETYSETSLKNAVGEMESVTFGLLEATPTQRRAMAPEWIKAGETLSKDSTAGVRLADLLKWNPDMGMTDEQSALLLRHKVALGNALNDAAERTWTEKTEEGKLAAQMDYNNLLEQYHDLLDSIKQRGSEWGREGRWRQAMAAEDYSFATQEARARAANGGKELSPTERDILIKKIVELNAEVERQKKLAAEKTSTEREAAIAKTLSEIKAEAKKYEIHPAVLKKAQEIISSWAARAVKNKSVDAVKEWAKSKIPQGPGAQTKPGGEGKIPAAVFEIQGIKLAKGLTDRAEFDKQFLVEYGQHLKPFMDEIWNGANEWLTKNLSELDRTIGKIAADGVRKAIKDLTPAENTARIGGAIRKRLAKGDKDISGLVQKLARSFVEDGVTERDELIDRVHDVLREINPEITRREAMDAISGYGDYKQLSKDAVSKELRDLKGQMQQVAKLEDMQEGKPPMKTGIERREVSIEESRLIKLVNEAKRKFQVPITDPNTQLKSSLDTLKKRIDSRTRELEQRLKDGDFAPRPKQPPITLDKEAVAASAKLERLKKAVDDQIRNLRLKNRPTYQKIFDFFTKFLRREFVLSSPGSVAKLTAAAIQGLTLEPIKEAVGVGIAKALPEFRKRLLTEAPSSVKIEAKALAEAFLRTAADAAQTIKTGKSDLEMKYGGRKAVPEEMVSYFGRMHAMLKTPLKRAVFTRVYAKLAEREILNGNDPKDILVDMRIGTLAMKEANRHLFLEDNMAVSFWQRGMSALEQINPTTGKPKPIGIAAAALMRWMLPIVRIPTNLIARTFQSAVGLPVGGSKLAWHYLIAKDIKAMPEEHADLIMRQLKAGSIGTAFLLYGYFNAAQFGGFYQEGEKRKKGDLKPLEAKAPGWIPLIGGRTIPAYLLHRPEFLAMQLGAEIYIVSHSKIRKADMDNAGLTEGAFAGVLGLTAEQPFVNETLQMSKLMNKYTRDQWVDSQLANFINPQFVQWTARQMDKETPFSMFQDTTPRKPTGLKQNIEAGIPGLRKNVPQKTEPGGFHISEPKLEIRGF